MIHTTLNRLRACSPCRHGWTKLLHHLGKTAADDDPMPLLTVLESNGLDDALWCLQAEPQHSALWRLYAVRCARRVQHLMTDRRSLEALDVAERHAIGSATDDELAAAEAAAWATAKDVAGAARAAAWAARAAVWDVAGAAARAAAWDAAWAAAWDAAWAATEAARAAQENDLRVVFSHYDAQPGREAHAWRTTNEVRQ